MVFDGHLSNKNSWFSKQRLVFSPYIDLKRSPTNYFGIQGDITREWFINKSYGGCGRDAGWLVFYSPGIVCSWEPKTKFQIKYSRANRVQNWSRGVYALQQCICIRFMQCVILLLQVMWGKQMSWLSLLTD